MTIVRLNVHLLRWEFWPLTFGNCGLRALLRGARGWWVFQAGPLSLEITRGDMQRSPAVLR